MRTKLEKALVEHASPTLAGLKMGSLFRYTPELGEAAEKTIHDWDAGLLKKGVSLRVVKWLEGGVLIYVYRPAKLRQILTEPDVADFLAGQGYPRDEDIEVNLNLLRSRLEHNSGFPHEIGIFLGYPLEDVRGFIAHQGRQYSLCGFWKVYGDSARAEQLFTQYRKCKDIYRALFEGGSSVLKLTVAA